MATLPFEIDLGKVNLAALETEDDFRRVAKQLLPEALKQIGEQGGKKAWEKAQKAFKKIPGAKANTSSSDKQKYIRQSGEKNARNATATMKRVVEDEIVKRLRAKKLTP